MFEIMGLILTLPDTIENSYNMVCCIIVLLGFSAVLWTWLMVLPDILSSKCLKEDINVSCYHLLRHDYLLSLIPLRPPGFPLLTSFLLIF